MSDKEFSADTGTAEAPEDTAEAARFFRRSVRLQSPHEALQPETPPPPPHRRRPRLSAVSGFLSFLLIGAVGVFFVLMWAEHRIYEPGPLAGDKVVFIERGAVFDILSTLETEGVIDSAIFVNAALWAEGKRDNVKAGEYLFRANASIHDVIDTLVSGKQILHAITIPEGLTTEQVVQRLRASDVLVGDVREMPKEGTLLPETYKVPRGMLLADLIKKMQDDQKKVLDQIWAHRAPDLPIHSPYELVTLASIVEKETGKADERPRVASVFLNRLQKRMRLQSDPTIVYGLVGGRGTLGRPITRAEVEKPTAYNTYTIDGLPPGPIANPGRAALEAVANPSRTMDLYFVADGTGGHVFSESLEQHNRNVQRWRQIEKEKDKTGADVDKVGPQTLPPRGDQRGQLDTGTDYGSLPSRIDVGDTGTPPDGASLDLATAALAFASVTPKLPDITAVPPSTDGKNARGRKAKARSGTTAAAFNVGPGLDSLGIMITGVGSTRSAATVLDGPVTSDQTSEQQPDPGIIAASAARQAELREKAAKLGLDPASSALPPAGLTPLNSDAPPPPPAAPAQKLAHAKVIDASEGTPNDPLLDHTYDLNYAKTVPPPESLK